MDVYRKVYAWLVLCSNTKEVQIISVILLLLSFANPFTIPGAPPAMIIALDLMHVVAAAIIVGVLTTLPVKR